jgi:nucleoside-diphosphate-sugar epimerase
VVAPCIKGTKNVLNQAKKTPSVKRIVLTSSINAMYSDAKDILDSEEKVLNESFWNETASMDYEPYFFAKTLAEKDAWEKMEKQDQWDLVTICPGLILGPGVKCHRKARSVSLITSMGNGTYKWGILELAVVCVDVRDVSRAHIEAAFRPEANGRYIVTLQDEPTNYFAISQMLRAVHPEFEGGPQWPETPNSKNIAWTFGPLYALHRRFISRNVGYPVVVDASRSELELNLKYRPLSETLRDMAKQIIDEGLWSKEHMAEEARLAKEEEKRLKELEKEERLKRRELRLAKEAEEREKAKQERAAEKERLREEKKRAKEERERERLGYTNNAEPNSNDFTRDNSVSNMV